MASPKQPSETNKKTNNDISALNKVASSILSVVDSGYAERTRLSSKNNRFQSIIDRELDLSKGVAGDSIVDFVMSVQNETSKSGKKATANEIDTTSIFTKDMGEIYNYFQDMYKNRYIEMTDLKFISKFIPALGEAVKTTLDAIVSSDDISETVTRNIVYASNISESDRELIGNEIARFEKELKLLKKLRNIVYKKALVTGKYYIYAVSYKDLFEEYSRNKANGKYRNTSNPNLSAGLNLNRANESYTDDIFDMDPVIESTTSYLKDVFKDSAVDLKRMPELTKSLKDNLPVISFGSDSYLSSAIEGVGAIKDSELLQHSSSSSESINFAADGTKDFGKAESFEIDGTYIKYVESKNMVPIKILDKTIGYYHILPTIKPSAKNRSDNMVNSASSIFSNVNMSERRKEEVIGAIIGKISDGIIKKFSAKFVSDNSTYKQMIADCIISHGVVDNDYMIQFIPAEHVVEFVINEDENGNGESILSDSLFPAKMLLSLIICKMLTYMNKSGNKTLAHVYKGPIDANSNNQLNRVVRMLQDTNITFNDLLSTNTMFSKFTRDSNIALPTAKNGNKLIEMETMEGQQVDLHTDFEDKLEQMAILGTGVPNVILEYVNQVDFAKSIVSANIKFAGRVSTLQSDLEDPTTHLYRIILGNSSLPDDIKLCCKSGVSFKLPRPRVLSNLNNSDFIQNLQTMATTSADIICGQNPENDPKIITIKDKIIKEIVVSNSPFLDWNKLEEMYRQANIDASKLDPPKSNSDDSSSF